MKDEIKVGEYIRTKENGIIWNVYDKDDIHYCVERAVDGQKYSEVVTHEYLESRIKKHSSNIIDLIEEGDYVNGYKVYGIEDIKNLTGKVFTVFKKDNSKIIRIWGEKDIKSIVTKEQFKNNEYVI